MTDSAAHGFTRSEFSRRTFLAIGAAVGATATLTDLAAPTAAFATGGTTYYVAKNGSDTSPGTSSAPLRTIGAAALLAQPGDTVVVRAGVYREEIVLPRGGTSAAPITYEAETGAAVTITGSNAFATWIPLAADVWQLKIANADFHGFNPYAQRVYGDWFSSSRVHRVGMVYLNAAWLPEAASLDAVITTSAASWWSDVDGLKETVGTGPYPSYKPTYDPNGFTTITAKFPGVNPNNGAVEVGMRGTVFKPADTNYDYITIRGFKLTNAATNWAAPTMGQWGLISAYWCKGWVIEDNEIAYSRCSGIALGKYSDKYDSTRGSTNGYYLTIDDAQKIGADGTEAGKWSFANIGGHTVRNNTIHHCGQTGIVGSLGAIGSKIIGNEIYHANTQGIWSGAEMAGIKLHAPMDVEIIGNHIYNCGQAGGIWLDWMSQGTRLVGNLMHHNARDLYLEVNHGPIFLANNVLLSGFAFYASCDGLAWAHNLIAGAIQGAGDGRTTPYFVPHTTTNPNGSTSLVTASIPIGAQQWSNNVLGRGVNLTAWDGASPSYPIAMKANVYTAGAVKSAKEQQGVDASSVSFAPALAKGADGWYLTIPRVESWRSGQQLVSTGSLAPAPRPNQAFTMPDGSAMQVDTDFHGTARNLTTPFPGPFELAGGATPIKVWSRVVPTTDAWGLPPAASPNGPAAANDGSENITVFTRGADGQLHQRSFTGGVWMPALPLAGPTAGTFTGAPAVAARIGRTDVFVRGTDDQLWQKTWTQAAGWGSWTALGGVLASSPAVASDANGNITVLMRGTDGQVHHRAFTGGTWSPWAQLGGPAAGTFTGVPAVAAKVGRTDVFVRGTDDQLWQKTWTQATGWGGWTALGGVLADSPGAASDTNGNINVHVRGSNGQVHQRAFTGGSWNSWLALGAPTGGLKGAPAVAAHVGRTDTFVRGADDQLWQRTWTKSAGFSAWTPLGGTFD